MILLTPALRALKCAYPTAHLVLMLRPLVAELMSTHPYLDEVIIDTKDSHGSWFSELRRMVSCVRGLHFDLAIVLHPTSFRNALIPFLARVPERVGSNVNGRGILLTQSCSDRTDLHEIHRYLRVLKRIGIRDQSAHLEFWHTEADCHFVDKLLANCGVSPGDRLVGVNLGTTWQTKRWSLENFATVITALQDRFDTPPILTGSASEIPLGQMVQQMTHANVINLIGKTTITQLGALIERFDLYLTCDSGPMHIAAAVDTPTVALFGPTNPDRHRPYGDGHYVIEKPISCRPCYKQTCRRNDSPYLCMTEIQATDVVEQIIASL